MAEDCLFCKIVAGEIPSDVIADEDDVYAFRDIAPAAPTHALVVPKQHIGGAPDVEAEHGPILASMIDVANRIAREEGVADSGYRLIFNVGPDAGQTVFHLHLHVLGGRNLGPLAG